MESRIQVLKAPFNILQLTQDKRNQFSSPGWLSSKDTSNAKCQRARREKHDSHFFLSLSFLSFFQIPL